MEFWHSKTFLPLHDLAMGVRVTLAHQLRVHSVSTFVDSCDFQFMKLVLARDLADKVC